MLSATVMDDGVVFNHCFSARLSSSSSSSLVYSWWATFRIMWREAADWQMAVPVRRQFNANQVVFIEIFQLIVNPILRLRMLKNWHMQIGECSDNKIVSLPYKNNADMPLLELQFSVYALWKYLLICGCV